ncbi:MAG: DNA repair protein RecN, partial [Flavihumibacter sp.]
DTPVSLQQLQELAGQLVDLHRQFDTLHLASAEFQLEVVDAMAGNEKRLDAYSTLYTASQEQQQKLQQLQNDQAQYKKELDYNQFLYDELEAAQLQENALETAEEELQLLNNAEGIKQSLAFIDHTIRQQDQPVLQLLKQMQQLLQAYAAKHAGIEELRARLQSVQVELNDIAAEAEQLGDRIGYDPERAGRLQEQLNAGYRLLKKHGVQTTQELLEIRENISARLLAVQQGDDEIKALQTSVSHLRESVEKAGAALSAARQSQLTPIEKAVNKLLARIGMPNARLKIEMYPAGPGARGMDQVEFLFDANKSGQFAPLRKVASGGELSRLMLSIKSLVAGKMDLPTLIFDEIDTGISGEASLQVGQIMKELALNRQVICITHQPQIAGKADMHLFVYKEPNGRQVQTRIRVLEKEARIRAIAEMLGGASPSAAALENAREMVQSS